MTKTVILKFRRVICILLIALENFVFEKKQNVFTMAFMKTVISSSHRAHMPKNNAQGGRSQAEYSALEAEIIIRGSRKFLGRITERRKLCKEGSS